MLYIKKEIVILRITINKNIQYCYYPSYLSCICLFLILLKYDINMFFSILKKYRRLSAAFRKT